MLSEVVDAVVNHGRESAACEGNISIPVGGRKRGEWEESAIALEERA